MENPDGLAAYDTSLISHTPIFNCNYLVLGCVDSFKKTLGLKSMIILCLYNMFLGALKLGWLVV